MHDPPPWKDLPPSRVQGFPPNFCFETIRTCSLLQIKAPDDEGWSAVVLVHMHLCCVVQVALNLGGSIRRKHIYHSERAQALWCVVSTHRYRTHIATQDWRNVPTVLQDSNTQTLYIMNCQALFGRCPCWQAQIKTSITITGQQKSPGFFSRHLAQDFQIFWQTHWFHDHLPPQPNEETGPCVNPGRSHTKVRVEF